MSSVTISYMYNHQHLSIEALSRKFFFKYHLFLQKNSRQMLLYYKKKKKKIHEFPF